MRGLVFFLGMAGLLPAAVAAPMVGVIAYYWISFMSPQMEVWGFAAAPPWALLSVLATLLGCLVAREPKRWPRNGMIPLLILFLILTSIATYFALGPRDRVIRAWSDVAKTIFFLLVLALLLSKRERVHALIWIMVLSLGFYGVVGGLFALVTGGHFRIFGPPASIIGDNNQLAAALLVTLPLMNYLRLQSRHRLIRIGLAVAMGLTLLSILASYSRGAFVGLAAVSLFFWWNSKHKIVIGLTMVIVIGAGLAFMPASWTERMHSITDYKTDPSAEGRLTVWHEAIGIALARPLTGGGYKSTATPRVLHHFYPHAHPRAVHSIWFEVLSENGFPAFAVWLSMMFLGFLNIRRIRKLARGDPGAAWADDLGRMAKVSLIAFATAGSFLSLGYYDLYLAILVALGATRDLVANERGHVAVPKRAPMQATTRLAQARPAISASGWRMRRVDR